MDNIDAQRTTRYACTQCECTQYSSPKGLKCINCDHVPLKHSDTPPPPRSQGTKKQRGDSDDPAPPRRGGERRRGSDSDDDRGSRRKGDKDEYSNYDVQGNKRFNCTECKCDGYWWKESLPDTKCVLCGHMPAAHGSAKAAPPSKPAPSNKNTKQFQSERTTNLDRNRKPRERCKCGDCDGYERLESGSDCVNCSHLVDHHPLKAYGRCKDCNCEDYAHDVKGGQFDCECGHKIAKHEKLTATETKSYVSDQNSAPKSSGPKKCGCGRDVFVDNQTGKAFDKCRKNCPGVPSPGTVKLCQKCNKNPVYKGSQFCSNFCRNAK